MTGLTRSPSFSFCMEGEAAAPEPPRITGFNSLADREGFFVAYPDGTGRLSHSLLTWNSGNCCGDALDANVDDTGFLRNLLSALETDWKIDPNRIFATGISNGGMMSYRLACELSDKLAAVAPVAGALNVEPCAPSVPVSLIAFHGTADNHVLYEGGRPIQRADRRHPRIDKSVSDSVSFWAKHNRCDPTPARVVKRNIAREVYSGCKNATAVELVTVQGGGHSWPGGVKWAPWAEEPTKEISATETMWEFFAAHPKRP